MKQHLINGTVITLSVMVAILLTNNLVQPFINKATTSAPKTTA